MGLSAIGLGALILDPRRVLARAVTERRFAAVPRHSTSASSVGRLLLCADDGHISNVWLGERMQELGLVGSFFIHTGQVGKNGRVSWQDIEELGATNDICSHGAFGGYYTQLPEATLKDYLMSAKLDLLNHGRGRDALVFGPPNDDIDARVRSIALSVGYEMIRCKSSLRILPGVAEFRMYGVSDKKSEAFYLEQLNWCASGPSTCALALVFHRIGSPAGDQEGQCDPALAEWLLDRAVESLCPKLRFTDLEAPNGTGEPVSPAGTANLPLSWAG